MHHYHDDLNQAVTLTFDPELKIGNCHCWQLLRRHDVLSKLNRESGTTNTFSSSSSSYTIQDSDDLINNDGVVLVAMAPDGTPLITPTTSATVEEQKEKSLHHRHQHSNNIEDTKQNKNDKKIKYLYAAPSLENADAVLKNPVKKDTVTLVPFYFDDDDEDDQDNNQQHNDDSRSANSSFLFTWKISRFPGGGIAFSTTMKDVRDFFARRNKILLSSQQEQQLQNDDTLHYYLTDEARLLSDTHTDGNPVGFGMNLAYPPVVDVTSLLMIGNRNKNNHHKVEAIEKTKRFLIDAAVDCGFFFCVIQYDDGESQPFLIASGNGEEIASGNTNHRIILASHAHCASERLMQTIRRMFGRSVSAKQVMMMEAANETIQQDHDQQPRQNNYSTSISSSHDLNPWSCIVPLDAKMTKVTLKSTTGEVKTSFNPPISVRIELPRWMTVTNNDDDDSKENENQNESERRDLAFDSSQPRLMMNHYQDDLETHFRFGEKLAARIVGILMKGVDSSMTQWPTEEMIRADPKTFKSIEVTKIVHVFREDEEEEENEGKVAQDDDDRNNVKYSIPRVAPHQFYSLFRSVCYPPSTRRRHDRKLMNIKEAQQHQKEEENEDETDDQVEYVYEEIEEEEEKKCGAAQTSSSSSSSSHKSSDTDDSEGKGLYEHTDKTWITLLTACPSLHGLEVVDCDGSTFTECCVPKFQSLSPSSSSQPLQRKKIFTFVCNIGDALQMVSKGKYISRTHRARNPNREEENQREKTADFVAAGCSEACRVSLPLFVEPTPHRWPVPFLVEETESRVL